MAASSPLNLQPSPFYWFNKFLISFPSLLRKNIVGITVTANISSSLLWYLISAVLKYFNFPWLFFKISVFPDSKQNSSTFPWPWRILTWASNKNFTYRSKLKHVKEFMWGTERANKKNITTRKYRCINKRKSTTQEVNSNEVNSVQRPRDNLLVFHKHGCTPKWKSTNNIHTVSE